MSENKEKILEQENLEKQDSEINSSDEHSSYTEDLYYESSGEEDLEKDYFGESEEESESEEGAWEDSESCEEALRKKHKVTPTWINDKKVKKEISLVQKKLSYVFDRYVFKTNFNIKILKRCFSYLVLVDTMNNVYLLKDNELVKSFKIEKFRIDDIVGFNGKIYLVNSKCGYLKEIDENLNIDNIEKSLVRNMRLAFASDWLYIMGDTTIVVNKQLNCIKEYYDKIISMTEFQGKIVAINSVGDVLVFSKDLSLEKKVEFDEGVSFTGIYSTTDYLVINSLNSIIFLDGSLQIVKEAPHGKNPVNDIVHTQEHFFCFSTAQGGLKILDKNLHFNNSFPKNKIKLPEAKRAVAFDNSIYICFYRDLCCLKVLFK
ncbi:hypothetical protein NGRA_0051 [Nosema granulosis]|uniref:Uncharacterized protein n=1 Tax=Nosema granulosis TaxID=83296 RepID=A0A9P6H111_9MICR|nr:hypothetical protein NGRA_0051 [Nosema granulosis]